MIVGLAEHPEVAGRGDRSDGVVQGLPVSGGGHLPCGMAVSPLPAQLPRGRELLPARGIIASHETIRAWCERFGPQYAAHLRRRPQASDKWMA